MGLGAGLVLACLSWIKLKLKLSVLKLFCVDLYDVGFVCMFVGTKANHMPAAGKNAFNFSLIPEDHARFKRNVFLNSDDMSLVINRFINSYSEASERSRKKNKING